MRKEMNRLKTKLRYMDELHHKTHQSKMQYGKVLAQLENSEMIRRAQQDKIKELVAKVHKFKKQKREMQDKLYKNFDKS